MTMNSVDPQPVAFGSRKSTYAVLPFSKQGVIRATSVSPLMNLIPEPYGRSVTICGVCPDMGMFAMSTYGAISLLRKRRVGLTSISSATGTTSQPSGTSPISDLTKLSGN